MEIELASVIKAVREELKKSVEESRDESIRFKVDRIQLDLQIALSHSHEGSAGLKVWVLTGDAKASRSSGTTHTVTVELSARTGDGDAVMTSPRRRIAR